MGQLDKQRILHMVLLLYITCLYVYTLINLIDVIVILQLRLRTASVSAGVRRREERPEQ